MARYIDAEKFLEELEKQICDDCIDEVCGACGVGCARAIAREMPDADVAPKSEVAIEIIQDIAKACAPHDHHLNSLDFEIGYITAMNQVIAQLEESKKKYTEEG